MNIAFDCYSEKLVKADRLDNLFKAQPFRFVCPICGQTVNPAAKDSTKQRTHFRHLHEYFEQLLTFFTESPRSFKDIGIGYLSPNDDQLFDLIDDLESDGIPLDQETVKQILVLMFWDVMDGEAALGQNISDEIRKRLPGRSKAREFGLNGDFENEIDKKFRTKAQEVLDLSDKDFSSFILKAKEIFFASNRNARYYLNLSSVKIEISNRESKWYRCNKCGKISPFMLGNTCGACFDCSEVIPSYSFPKNVVSFYVEKSSARSRHNNPEIEYAPDRDISIALSEYAPGRFITIDKKTFRSGGIYSNPRPKGYMDNQAEYYFNNKNYYKDIFVCTQCNWFGNDVKEVEDGETCPYCHSAVEKRHMLKPWGFAPCKAEEIPHEDEEEEFTYTEAPYYSYVPNDSDYLIKFKSSNISYSQLPDRKVLTVNMGKKKNGFDVCRCCGGAKVADDDSTGNSHISQPYHSRKLCQHEGKIETNIFLGNEFLTDMFMLDILYNEDKLVCMRSSDERQIFKSAVTTLHEAIKKAVSLVLDIDYSEISGGWLPRITTEGETHIEMFFYDNLSSGAGYSSLIGSVLEEVLKTAEKILDNCECARSCKNCLDNYYNQRNHEWFDRHLGLQLLHYAVNNEYPEKLNKNEQDNLIAPLTKLINEDGASWEKIEYEVIPALRRKPNDSLTKMYFNAYDLSDWLPNSFYRFQEMYS